MIKVVVAALLTGLLVHGEDRFCWVGFESGTTLQAVKKRCARAPTYQVISPPARVGQAFSPFAVVFRRYCGTDFRVQFWFDILSQELRKVEMRSLIGPSLPTVYRCITEELIRRLHWPATYKQGQDLEQIEWAPAPGSRVALEANHDRERVLITWSRMAENGSH